MSGHTIGATPTSNAQLERGHGQDREMPANAFATREYLSADGGPD